jgi:uncharacterized protein with HEPN domain
MNLDLDTIGHIRDATRAMMDHISGHDRTSFEADRKTSSAVLFEIVIQGEGVKRLSPEFRDHHPEVPWSQIAGMRDRLVHSFDEIDFDIAWNVAQSVAPGLLADFDRIVAQEFNP